jgi:hypothetical protein
LGTEVRLSKLWMMGEVLQSWEGSWWDWDGETRVHNFPGGHCMKIYLSRISFIYNKLSKLLL